ncbi:MAG: right-handed parallel beta-helix repeat-containing protein [bacterium]|nr:right-handed parallel beta-helix repeat-containing protein [bacterium]
MFDIDHVSTDNPLYHLIMPASDFGEFVGPASLAFPTSDHVPWLVVGSSQPVFYARNNAPVFTPGCNCDNDDWNDGVSHCPQQRVYAGEYHESGSCQHFFSKVYAIRVNGDAWSWIVSGEIPMRLATPACGDLDNDNEDEIAFLGTSSYGILDSHCFNCPPDRFDCEARSRLSIWKITNNSLVEAANTVVQRSNDDDWNGTYLYRCSAGTTLPAIGDINGDEAQDIVTCVGESICCWNFSGGAINQVWTNTDLDESNQVVVLGTIGFTADAGYSCRIPCWAPETYDRRIQPAPLLADLNDDGSMEVYFMVSVYGLSVEVRCLDGTTGDYLASYSLEGSVDPNSEYGEALAHNELSVADLGAPDGKVLVFVVPYGHAFEDDHNEYALRVRLLKQNGQQLIDVDFEHVRFGFPFTTAFYDFNDVTWKPIDLFSPTIVRAYNSSVMDILIQQRTSLTHIPVNLHPSFDIWPIIDGTGFFGEGDPMSQEPKSGAIPSDIDGDGYLDIATTLQSSNTTTTCAAIEMERPYDQTAIEWAGYRNGPKRKGIYAQPVSGLQSQDIAVWEGRVIVHGTYTVSTDQSLVLRPGTVVEFLPGARLWIDGGELVANGTSTDSIYFVPDVESAPWQDILVSSGHVQLSHVNVSGALCGINMVGVDVARIDSSTIRDCGNGIRSTLTGNLHLVDVEVLGCQQSGLFVADGAVDLDNCVVKGCGAGGYPYPACFLNTHVSPSCTEINDNVGPGIFAYNSLLAMSYDFAFRGGGSNSIAGNSWSRGQIEFTRSQLAIRNGGNFVGGAGSILPPILIRDNTAPIDPPFTDLVGNYWPDFVVNEQYLLNNCVFPRTAFVCSDYVPSEFTACEDRLTEVQAAATISWNNSLDLFMNEAPAMARDTLKKVMRVYEDSDVALYSARQFVATSRANADGITAILDTLNAVRSGATRPELVSRIRMAQATALALEHESEEAVDTLIALIEDASISTDDSLAARHLLAQLVMFDELQSATTPEDIDAASSLYEARVDSVIGYYYEGVVFKPTLEWQDSVTRDRLHSSHGVAANAFTADGVPVSNVVIDYCIVPTATWIRDTLEQQSNDTTWEITLALDSLGGGIEYRLLAIDTLGRVETWPGTEGYPNLNDTLTHFVSFEPRLTAPLTDTAYVYAPGVITEDITIGDGGVLYILPAPVELDSYVVLIDSGVGITLSAEGGVMPKLVIAGTDSTVIRLECASEGDRWDGIQSFGGNVEATHAELRNASGPLYTEKQNSYPIVRFSDVEVSGFGSPLVFTHMNPGDADSSFIVDCTISDGDSSGMVILTGALDIEDVTIEGCDGCGVVLFEPADQLFSNVRITNNGGYGVTTDPEYSGSARLSNCYVAFNGDTLPEIKVYSNSMIDVSDYAGNIVKDSTGVLFECAEVNDFVAELGSNSFVLADSTGKYFNVANMSGPAYITGNRFYPESVNDSTFIDDFMKQDTLSKWVYSYLRAEDQMDDVIEDPNGSIDFELKANVQNYLGTVTSDTITQVGFKYRLFPDSTNWTTYRQNTIETDSIYDWTVSVGDQGGLVSYIWWVKDAHGRYMTSPAGADTTTPDSGATHFLSFEIADTSIVADSVTIWAPTTLTHNINVGCMGKLVVKPWPGASDHSVTMAEGVAITVIGNCGAGNRPMVWMQGSESMPITIEAAIDTQEWQNIYLNDAVLTATYTTFRTNLVAFEPGFWGQPEIKLDHCTIESSDGFFATAGTDVATSYLRNCVFRDLGMSWDDGSFVVYGGDIEISDCWFYNNGGNGIVLYEPLETVVSGTNSIANDLAGLLSWGVTSSASITCSEFSYNGGDSTSEVLILDGVVDFSNDAGNVFADKAVILLEGSAMENFELVDGGNGFYLFDSTGHYVYTGDETDTLNISGNLWYPWTPIR